MSLPFSWLRYAPNWFVPAWQFAFDSKAEHLFKRFGVSAPTANRLIAESEAAGRQYIVWRTELPYAHVPPPVDVGAFDEQGFGLVAVARLLIPGQGAGYGAYFGEIRRGAATEQQARVSCLKAQAAYYRVAWLPVPMYLSPSEGLGTKFVSALAT